MKLTGATAPALHMTARVDARRRGRTPFRADAAGVLIGLVVILIGIPSELVVKALGGNATPAMLVGLLLLLWWACAKVLSGSGIDRSVQPVRIALGLLALSIVAAYASGAFHHIQGLPQQATATQAQAAAALSNYLTFGEPRWDEVT